MIHIKVEKIGDVVAIVLDDETQRRLGVSVGDTLQLDETPNGVIVSSGDAVTRGKRFVERYIKTFEALAQ